MSHTRTIRPHLFFLFLSGLLAAVMPAHALDGSNNVFVVSTPGQNLGWKTFEIISGGDTINDPDSSPPGNFVWTPGGGIPQHRDFDGLGAYRHDANTLRVFVNHETRENSTFSRVDLNLGNLKTWIASGNANNNNSNQVAAPGQIVTGVSRGWLTVGAGNNPLDNPCSANVWLADTFGPGRGFADTLYLTGEETFDTSGRVWVMDVATRTLYECPDLGNGSWENGTIIDTGRTDTVAIVLSDDQGSGSSGTAPMTLYVGLKNPGGNFLERNGLENGEIYYWEEENENENATTNTGGIFAAGNGTLASGSWVSSDNKAALISKSEDLHTNMNPNSPGFGVEVALASQNHGIFLIDFSQVDFVAGDLGTNTDSDVRLLFKSGSVSGNIFTGMDNLVWSPDGNIYVNEDDSEGDIWQIDVDSILASYAGGPPYPNPNGSQVFDIMDANNVGESAGIIDISQFVDYEAGSVFLTSGMNTSTLSRNQIAMMVSPGATPLTVDLTYTAGANGSILGDASQAVPIGGDGTPVTAVPAFGFAFDDWSDGVTTATRTDTNVTADLSVTANFAMLPTYTLAYTAGPNGSLSGDASQVVPQGADGTAVTAVPDSGFAFVDWSDGVLAATRTDTNVTANLSVTANFAMVPTFTLSYTAGSNGTLTGNASQMVVAGGDGTPVTAVPDPGFEFDDWSDGVMTATRTDTNVTADITVTANFVALPTYTLTYTAGTGGSLTGNANQVVVTGGDGTAVTAVPGSGYGFVDWSDGLTTATRTDTNITADLNVTANFVVTNGYLAWIAGYPSLTGPDALPDADPEPDGVTNAWEYASNLDPTLNDGSVLVAGTGTAGLPLIELRTFGPEQRLVIEYLRRLGDPNLISRPEFSADLGDPGPWGPGGTENSFPINANWERVIKEDSVNVSGAPKRFAQLRLRLAGP